MVAMISGVGLAVHDCTTSASRSSSGMPTTDQMTVSLFQIDIALINRLSWLINLCFICFNINRQIIDITFHDLTSKMRHTKQTLRMQICQTLLTIKCGQN